MADRPLQQAYWRSVECLQIDLRAARFYQRIHRRECGRHFPLPSHRGMSGKRNYWKREVNIYNETGIDDPVPFVSTSCCVPRHVYTFLLDGRAHFGECLSQSLQQSLLLTTVYDRNVVDDQHRLKALLGGHSIPKMVVNQSNPWSQKVAII